MVHKLKKIKAETTEICTDISNTLRTQAAALESIPQPPFKNLDEFDKWFNSDTPLTL